jgi:hypothetical protein
MGAGETPEEWETRLSDRSQELQREYDTAAGKADAEALAQVADARDKLAQEYDELARVLDEIAAERDLDALSRDVAASHRDRTARTTTHDEDEGWANRFLSGTDRDRAAGDRAGAFDNRQHARRDRSEAATARTAAAHDRAEASNKQRRSDELVGQLREALASRTVIGQASGILIERFKLTPEQAFQLLVQASQRRNTKLRVVAQVVVETGQAPGDI